MPAERQMIQANRCAERLLEFLDGERSVAIDVQRSEEHAKRNQREQHASHKNQKRFSHGEG